MTTWRHARESSYTLFCKTTFPSPGRVLGNSGRVCKNTLSMTFRFWVTLEFFRFWFWHRIQADLSVSISMIGNCGLLEEMDIEASIAFLKYFNIVFPGLGSDYHVPYRFYIISHGSVLSGALYLCCIYEGRPINSGTFLLLQEPYAVTRK